MTEVTMSSTQTVPKQAIESPTAATLDLKLEVVVIPVSDVERAKSFYGGLGWRVDADFAAGDSWRLVQMTPPGSPCSVMFGKGFTTAIPGSLQGTFLVVENIDAAREHLRERGVDVTEVFHFQDKKLVTGTQGRLAGRDPENGSYFSFASFTDPDGNGWLLQEVTTRFPGRGHSIDVPTLIGLLQEAETRHGQYQAGSPAHHWSEWYAEYIVARHRGRTPDEAAAGGAQAIAGSRSAVQG
jgi:catechol 2,3-dioxygenase-like lactoylglutathione lyase family enzyme